MADRAKLFKSGGSQAVQLPKEYRFQNSEESPGLTLLCGTRPPKATDPNAADVRR